MNRSELINALAERFPDLALKDAEISVREVLEAIENTLAHGRHMEIRVPPKCAPHFKAGKELRERADRLAASDLHRRVG